MNNPPFKIKPVITEEDIDELGHVNNVIYLKWVQEAAVAHWKFLATAEQQESIVWVVTRHEIDYKLPAKSGDEITAGTWVGKSSGILFERFTEITRESDEKILASAKTLWCPVDIKTRRPVRVGDDIRKVFSTD
jgi:acyl-CoA thioester hydrolase